MRKKTRKNLLDRVLLYRQASSSDTSQLIELRQYLDHAYGRIWTFLCKGGAGFGQTRFDIATTTATTTMDLPANFEKLLAIAVNPDTNGGGWVPEYGSDNLSFHSGYNQSSPSSGHGATYFIEGPGEDWNGVSFDTYDQRIRWQPPLTSGQTVRLVYAAQPPSLADSDGQYIDSSQDLTISVDVINEPVEEALVAYARVWSASRSDSKETRAATNALQEVATDYLSSRSNRNSAHADRLSRYIAVNSSGGY